jgi:hypothetical protein
LKYNVFHPSPAPITRPLLFRTDDRGDASAKFSASHSQLPPPPLTCWLQGRLPELFEGDEILRDHKAEAGVALYEIASMMFVIKPAVTRHPVWNSYCRTVERTNKKHQKTVTITLVCTLRLVGLRCEGRDT